jgi:hypothetical protein
MALVICMISPEEEAQAYDDQEGLLSMTLVLSVSLETPDRAILQVSKKSPCHALDYQHSVN